jgi:small basic protein
LTGAESFLILAALGCVFGTAAATATARLALAVFLAGMVALTAGVLALLYAFQGDWLAAVLLAFVAVLWGRLWWQSWRRRKKKRSLRALGHKARARLAALARNMPRPGPVLRPAPQGARA